jgi:hypothetical protein
VVVVLAAGQHRLEARSAVAEVDLLDEVHGVEELERPIDARQADVPALLPQLLRDLLRRAAAALPGECLDHGLPRTAGTVAGVAQRMCRRFSPLGCPRSRHTATIATK